MPKPTRMVVDEAKWRRFVSVCERQRLSPRPVTHDEACRVEMVTIGESINFALVEKLLGKALATDYRARLGF